MDTNTQELIDALEDAGYEWREYSGRGMSGTRCVGVTLERESDLFTLGVALAELDGLTEPSTDSMGRGLIVYWPKCKIVGGS